MFERDKAPPAGTPTWCVLRVPDPTAAARFYRALLGWDSALSGPDGDLLARKGGRVVAGIGRPTGVAGEAPGWVTHLATDDLDDALATIPRAGGTVLPAGGSGDPRLGRSALARDAGGALFGLWEADELIGMEGWEAPGLVMFSENFTGSVAATLRFYSEVFGTVYAEPFPWHFGDPAKARLGYRMFATDGGPVGTDNTVGAIGELDPEDPVRGPHWTTCFGVTDVAGAVAELTRLGGTVLRGPYPTLFGELAIVTDDQGAPFMLGVPPQRP